MVAEETSFPRGGTAPVSAFAPVNKKSNLFDHAPNKKKIKKKVKHLAVTGTHPKLVSIEDLSYKDVSEGMIILAKVSNITDYHLSISLPGSVHGKVPVTQISEPYSQLLHAASENENNIEALCPLSELFFKGQMVSALVWQVRTLDNKTIVMLSLDPRLIYSEWSHTVVAKKGMIISAAVKSREEHGYVMDCGITGLRSFLKESKAQNYCEAFNGGRPLAIGQLVQCVVTKSEVSSVASKVELSADPEDIAKQEEKGHQSVDIQQMLPGMRFKVTVVERKPDGVRVKFFGMSGYIHQEHFPSPGSELEPGTTLFARVLYITPMVKTIYLSARPNIASVIKEIPKLYPAEVHFKIGDVVQGKVAKVKGRGIFLDLHRNKHKARGFVPEHRLGFNFKGKLEDNEDEISMLHRLKNKFPVGGTVNCRLQFFDTMMETYLCSMEKSVLNEKYFTLSDIHEGDIVPCVVEDIRNGGINVRIGKLSGFVPPTHSADVPLHQPSQMYQPGSRVSGRVLYVNLEEGKLFVTLKQSLVSSREAILSSYEDVRKGACYTGTVVAILDNFVVISFFGNVKGLLPKGASTDNGVQNFFPLKLVKCYVKSCGDRQIKLSLTPLDGQSIEKDGKMLNKKIVHIEDSDITSKVEEKLLSKSVLVGQCYDVEVVSKTSDFLRVKIINKGLKGRGVIPILHLSDDPKMANMLYETFSTRSKVKNVWCFCSRPEEDPVFSLRSSVIQFFKSVEGQIGNKKTLEAICRGWILPCTVQNIETSYLNLQVPLASVTDLIQVAQEQVCETGESFSSLALVEGQAIQAKVMKVLHKKKSLFLECRRSQLWNGELETCVMYLSKYLSDQQHLLQHAREIGDPIGTFEVGTDVRGVVKEHTEWGFILHLPCGTRGEMTFYNAGTDSLEIGSEVSGKVLFVDCVKKHVEITCRDSIVINMKQANLKKSISFELDTQLRGSVLLVTPEFVLVQLKGKGRYSFAYIPTFLYPYAPSRLTLLQPFFGIDRKFIVRRCCDGFIICLPKEEVTELLKNNRTKRIDDKLKEKSYEAKAIKNARYFEQDDLLQLVKKEDEEDSLKYSETAKAVLSNHLDPQIIDCSVNNSSEEVCLEPTLSEANSNSSDECSDVESTSSAKEENKNLVMSESTRKRKTSGSSDNLVPHSKKSKHENDLENAACMKNSQTKEKNAQFVSSDLKSTAGDGSLILQKRKQKDPERGITVSNETNGLDLKKSKKLKLSKEDDLVNNSKVQKSTLQTPGFLWDIDPTKFMQVLQPGQEVSSSDDDDDGDKGDKLQKKKHRKSAAERKEAARLEEERLQKVEKELLDPNRQLSSIDDFDRMVLASPDSSELWLQYMAFHLQATEIEKARAVAKRAISSISYREEQHKLNVWLGLLNLENLYGTSESLKSALYEALQANDPYKIRTHMVRMYAESGKTKELESEVRLVVKKFKEVPGMWHEIGTILMNHGYAEKARTLLQQALPHMRNKRDSVDLVVQFALMEAHNSNIEQAKALMDPILVSYPQRTDVWIRYCDMLVKANQISEARELLERAVNQKLPARKMKALFAKFLQFEESHGTKEGQDKVRAMAKDYVNQVAADE